MISREGIIYDYIDDHLGALDVYIICTSQNLSLEEN